MLLRPRRHHPTLPLLALFVASACADAQGIDDFDITRSAEAVIQGSLLTQVLTPLGFAGLSDMQLSNAQEMANQGVKPHQIDSVKLKLLRLRVTKPASGQDLTFLKRVKFYAESKGLEKKLVAQGGPFAAGTTQADLQLLGTELKPYVTAASMSLTTEVEGHAPGQDTTLQATVTLRVDVDVSGAIAGP